MIEEYSFQSYVPFVIAALVVVAVLAVAGFIARHIAHQKRQAREGDHANVTFMVTLPKFRDQDEAKGKDTIQTVRESIGIAETFFAAIGGMKPERGFRAWFGGRVDSIALEIVAHKKLVTFYVTIPKFLQSFVEQQLNAQYSDAHIEPVRDYNMFSPTGVVVGGYLAFKRPTVFPVKTYKELDADPLNALTNALSKVEEGDGVAIQYVIRSAPSSWRKLGAQIVKHMNEGMTVNEAIHGKAHHGWFANKEEIEKKKAEMAQRKMSQSDTKMVDAIGNKISKAGVDANIRIVASASSSDVAVMYMNNVLQAFSQYNVYEYGNSFVKVLPSSKHHTIDGFINRTLDEHHKIILNTEEMASLWHLPLPTTDTPNIRWMLARTAPAPTNMPTEGLHLGYNMFRGNRTEVYMREEDRRRHMYLMGKTGTGKSEFIKNLAIQDIRNGKGVCVIDPHGDLADGLLALIPKERYDDIVYFNPSDQERPMGLNMLEAPTAQMRDFVVQEMISIFYMLFPPEMIGPMFEHQMRNYMLTLMSDVEHPGTIVEIPRLISDEKFQAEWVAKVKDPVVRSFWEDEMAKTSDYHKSEMMGYLVSKVGRFVENEMMRNIIGQTKSSFNFREIMDTGKILLINLSKGKTGDVNANLLGLIIVTKLQMAAFTRADVAEEDRKDFYLYIDEFQNFVTPSIATILSEARKYRLNLVMAHQYMGQLVKDNKTEIRDAVLGNVGSLFISRIGPDDTDVFGKIYEPTFSPYDLMNNAFLSWNAKMIIENSQGKPFTLTVNDKEDGKPRVGEALKEISRLLYGRDKKIVEREIAVRAGIGQRSVVAPPPETAAASL